MAENFEEVSDPTIPRLPLIVHVPHSATTIPPEYRQDFVLPDDELDRELLLMTDHYTDELATTAVGMGAVIFRNRFRRLVMDPERFAEDAAEPMARLGMGAVYLSRQDGASLRQSASQQYSANASCPSCTIPTTRQLSASCTGRYRSSVSA